MRLTGTGHCTVSWPDVPVNENPPITQSRMSNSRNRSKRLCPLVLAETQSRSMGVRREARSNGRRAMPGRSSSPIGCGGARRIESSNRRLEELQRPLIRHSPLFHRNHSTNCPRGVLPPIIPPLPCVPTPRGFSPRRSRRAPHKPFPPT